MKTSPSLIKYKKNKFLYRKVGEEIPKMSFGLHIGWAIEGAIGSNHKIDASYLSPHVTLASRLMSATKQFGVQILFSGQIYDWLSNEIQALCRNIDIVNVKGSKKAMRLYTYDMDLKKLPSKEVEKITHRERALLKKN